MKNEEKIIETLSENKIKAVIFDMDGTIIDTEHIWQRVMADFLFNKGVAQISPRLKDALKNSSGGGSYQAVTLFKQEYNFPEPVEVLLKEKIDMSMEYMQKYEINFIKGFQEFHAKLREQNIPTSIGTNANIPVLTLLNNKLNFNQFFGPNLYCMEHVGNKAKPDPAVFLHAAEKLNVKPEECLVFEDSISGFGAAKKAGMTLVGIKNQYNKDIINQADFAIDDYTQAHEIIEKLYKK